MTSKISLFNKGIYKSVIRRYMWGSVLYAILLFMFTAMVAFFFIDLDGPSWYPITENDISLLMYNQYLWVPIIMGLFVPTVVALLVYRFVHSKKTSIFVHSLPVSRSAIYLSTILAALTLMAAPILLNGLILVVMSLSGYGKFFTVGSCFVWMGANLLTVFLMFSAATLVAMLTGNSFAMVVLNGLIHCILLIIAAGFSSISSAFLFGYNGTNEFLTAAMEWNFVAFIVDLANQLGVEIVRAESSKIILMIILAVVFYGLGFLLYRKRRMETAEEVAAFKCLNPVYKYLITFIAALSTFGIFCEVLEEHPVWAVLVTVIVSVVTYFASEMILKKSFRIWKSWKGYAVFTAVFAAGLCVFAFTTFFGYETRVPNPEKVESIAVYEYYAQAEEPWISDREIIDYTTSVHEEIVNGDDIYTVKKYVEDYTTAIHIKYKLKNGKTITRRYPVTEQFSCRVLDRLYESELYRMKVMEEFSPEIGKLYAVDLDHGRASFQNEETMNSLMEALKKDLMTLDYTQMHTSEAWRMHIRFEYALKEDIEAGKEHYGIRSTSEYINANYKNTIKWLRDNWYGQFLLESVSTDDLFIMTADRWELYAKKRSEILASSDKETVSLDEALKFSDLDDVERISDEEKKREICEYIVNTGFRFVPDKEYAYYVCAIDDSDYVRVVAGFYADNPEIMEFTK